MSVQPSPGEDGFKVYNRIGQSPLALFLPISDTLNTGITEPKELLIAQVLCLQFTPEIKSSDTAGNSRPVWSDSFSKPHSLEDFAQSLCYL